MKSTLTKATKFTKESVAIFVSFVPFVRLAT